MNRKYTAVLVPVPNRSKPPVDFLDLVIDTVKGLPIKIFAVIEHRTEIYSLIGPYLGPFKDDADRLAAMCEALRVIAAYESDYDWNCGPDASAGPETLIEQETGAFQVSANSMLFDESLSACVAKHAGKSDALTFIHAMKKDHALAVEYVIRLLRIKTTWDGPLDRGDVQRHLSRPAMAEFKTFLV